MNRTLNIIVAVDIRGGFARKGKIPWKSPKDFKRFQEITKDHYCIMGRRTYEEIEEIKKKKTKQIVLPFDEPILSDRESIVLSRNSDFAAAGARTRVELQQALDLDCTDENKKIFILGGEKLFIQAFPDTGTIYQTVIDHDYKCDQFFLNEVLAKKFKIVEGKEVKERKKTLWFTKWERTHR